MKVIYKAPGCAPEPRDIPNTLEELQATVGGYIETVTFASDALVDREHITGLQFNKQIPHCQPHALHDVCRIASGKTVQQHTAIVPNANRQAGLLVIVAGAAGHIPPIISAFDIKPRKNIM